MTKTCSMAVTLGDWVASNSRPQSDSARKRALAALADGIACIFAGSRDSATETVLQSTLRSHGRGDCLVLGHKETLPPAGAALVNGTAAHALDFDDNFLPGLTHATAVLVPALLAAGQATDSSGLQILEAYMVGLELHARIGALVNPNHYEAGWHATATTGTIGTAGAVASLIGLSAGQITTAMSIAFSLASGSKIQFGTTTKPTHAGFAAHNAVQAAFLARHGLEAQTNFLTGQWGFRDLFGAGASTPPEEALAGLGATWAIESHGLMAKRFPCCGSAHKALDAVEMLKQEHGISLDNIEKVTAYLPTPLHHNLRFDTPKTASEARFSFSYPAVRLLAHGYLSLGHFTDEAVQEEAIRQHLGKFVREDCQFTPKTADYPVRATAILKNGAEVTTEIRHVRGSIDSPLSDAETHKKFTDCLAWSGTSGNETLYERIQSFDRHTNVSSLFNP
ncbi:MmgE/PrpD family protein [Sneathiella chinensis]|uniref:2-methylcitrate dehydratase n=1 Tax=Sneathiella chinensis TaxID=349750 RepID=A0ABQ5U0P8_9PROT|nr:MmgE/PrpD family protein [Sneathiella chinensis]GLQ04893.1 2-methylcitrate dehydratase [Sneathiella chinensis]